MMSRLSVRTLFVIAVSGLVLQYGLIGVVSLGAGEPWPAIIQPGFKSVWDGSETVRIPRADLEVVMASGRRHPLPLDRLFEGIPASHHLGMLRAQFRPSSLSGTSSTERALMPDTRVWLYEQLARLFPDEQALLLLAIWKEVEFNRASEASVTHPIDTLVIEFDEHASRTLR